MAEQAGLSELIAGKVAIRGEGTKVATAWVNPAGKLTSIVAGMAAGADCIDDLDVIRCGGMPRLFAGVYAPAPLGQLLREFTPTATPGSWPRWPGRTRSTWSGAAAFKPATGPPALT